MIPQYKKIKGYVVTYFSKEELKILETEIFSNEIYNIDLNTQSPKIIDAGAHIGLTILFFKSKYPTSKIIAFEPNPNTFPILEENIICNKIKDVELLPYALAKKDGERQLYIDSSSMAAFSTSSFLKDAWNGKQKSIPITVKTTRLSKHINENIDLLKLDIEGNEYEVLNEIFLEDKLKYIKNIIVEYHPHKKQRITKLTSLLEQNGFKLRYFEEGIEITQPKEELILVMSQKRKD